MKLRTEISIPESDYNIGLQHKLLSVGSCFSHQIGQRLQQSKFNILVNPFGTVFQPENIFRLLSYSLKQAISMKPDRVLEREGIFYHYDLHSSISATSEAALAQRVNRALLSTRKQLQETRFLFLTFGSAINYYLQSTGEIVTNNHKMPAGRFFKKRARPDDLLELITTYLDEIFRFNPQLRVIVTVSPVRHTREGIAENSLSKSVLRVTAHEMARAFPRRVSYFPAYEIMIDDLRDYRFYANDLVHPNTLAEQYIWEQFTQTYLDRQALDFLPVWNKIQQAMNHRPQHPESAAHQKFLNKTLDQLKNLNYPVNVDEEIHLLKKQITRK